jgi:hypothetical protein
VVVVVVVVVVMVVVVMVVAAAVVVPSHRPTHSLLLQLPQSLSPSLTPCVPHPTLAALPSYNACARRIIERRRVQDGTELANVLIASHNQSSIELVVSILRQHGMTGGNSNVYFGQLLGMSDHLTFCLGAAGYKAYK